jgi:hypothetical protein
MKPEIVVASASPHRFAGKEFITGSKAFPLDHFDREHFEQMLNDKLLTVVVGTPLTLDNLDEFLAARDEQLKTDEPAAPEKKPAKGAKA